MKTVSLSLLLSALVLAGCAGTQSQSSKPAASPAASAPASSSASPASSAPMTEDQKLAAAVQKAIAADAELAPFKITTTSAEGKVTLKGEIKSIVLRRKAESIAKETPGVKSVDNQLIITG